MKKYALALLVAAFAVTGIAKADPVVSSSYALNVIDNKTDKLFTDRFPSEDSFKVAQSTTATQSAGGSTIKTDAPLTSTTVVKGGGIAADILDWMKVAFGTALATLALGLLYKVMGYFGIQTTQMQRDQLQEITVNGLNAAAVKAEAQLRNNPNLDINVKSQVIQDAISYTQSHGAETIKALGLDPKSGQAVEAIRARIETAINDPAVATPDVVSNQPLAPRV